MEFFDKLEAFIAKIFEIIANIFKLFEPKEEGTEDETEPQA